MGAATQLWLISYHVRMGSQSSQSTFHFQKVKNTDLYMKLPNSAVRVNKIHHWPTGHLWPGDQCWLEKLHWIFQFSLDLL